MNKTQGGCWTMGDEQRGRLTILVACFVLQNVLLLLLFELFI